MQPSAGEWARPSFINRPLCNQWAALQPLSQRDYISESLSILDSLTSPWRRSQEGNTDSSMVESLGYNYSILRATANDALGTMWTSWSKLVHLAPGQVRDYSQRKWLNYKPGNASMSCSGSLEPPYGSSSDGLLIQILPDHLAAKLCNEHPLSGRLFLWCATGKQGALVILPSEQLVAYNGWHNTRMPAWALPVHALKATFLPRLWILCHF